MLTESLVTTGVLAASVRHVKQAFVSMDPRGSQDALTTISATRCLKLYLERLGALDVDSSSVQDTVSRAFMSGQFVSIQPSLLAAVAYLGSREEQGLLPAWPWALADLTGWQGAEDSRDGFGTVLTMMRAFSRAD